MHVQIPPPIALKDLRTGGPFKVQKLVDNKVEIVDHTAESLHDFVIDRLIPAKSTFQEERKWTRVLDKLAEAEQQRANGVTDVWVDIDDEAFDFFKTRMEKLELNGYVLRQFMTFMNALSDAKRERPSAQLKSVDE